MPQRLKKRSASERPPRLHPMQGALVAYLERCDSCNEEQQYDHAHISITMHISIVRTASEVSESM
jgi:hypothetical protein